ncbi:hypothetical protein, partial [Alienimonas chondri]|uniref:hypothetical protein n=1 Tax=Alienimonas chondri TaxID=2681879 RepID=UPI00148A0B09
MLDEAAALVRADLPPAAVDAAFLNRLQRGARSAGAAVWEIDGDEAHCVAASGALSEAVDRSALIRSAADNPAAMVPPLSDLSKEGAGGNPTPFTLALCPIALQGGRGGAVVEAAFDPAEVRGGELLALEAVRAFAEIWEEGRTRRELARLRDELARQRSAAAFAARLHAAGGLAATERTLADGGRAALGVDRLTVAAPSTGTF